MDEFPEHAWLSAAQRFEPEALATIYDAYSPRIYAYAMRLLGDRDLAEECVAETFSRFLQALYAGRGPRSNLRAYLYRTAHNWITDRYRRQPPPTLELSEDTSQTHDPQPDQHIEQEEARQRLRRALWRLTADQRQVIVLRFLEDLDLETVAAAMKKPIGAIKALQHRALINLKKMLASEVQDAQVLRE